MADTAVSTPAAAASTKKSDKLYAAHPKTAVMVDNAIRNLKERGGSSLQAIKKHIASNYKVDAEKLAPFIRKYIKSAVTSGALVQTKGRGATGSFKLASKEKVEKKVLAKPKKAAAPAKEKAPATKKSPAAKKPKSPSKSKRVAKAPTAGRKPKRK